MTLEVADILEELVSELPAGTIIIVTPGKDPAADAAEDLAEGEYDDPYWMFDTSNSGNTFVTGGSSGGSSTGNPILLET